MPDQNSINPEAIWAEMIHDFGDEHGPLTPKLAQGFSENPYSLMWHVSWFKFAGKMIGRKERTLVFDPLEGLGGWTVACETGDVVAIISSCDSYEAVRSAWPDDKIIFEKNSEILMSAEKEFNGVVSFDIGSTRSRAGWDVFFADAASALVVGGVVVAGGVGSTLSTILRETAAVNFKHVFMFGSGQHHPCISPADAVIVVAC